MDDEVAGHSWDWHPWIYRPVCTKVSAQLPTKYCTYSHVGPRGGGISFSTTPEVAAAAAIIIDDNEWQKRRDASSANINRSCEVGKTENMGKGAFSTRKIKRNEIIFEEYPFIVDLTEAHEMAGYQATQLLERAFIQLPKENRKRILNMARPTGTGRGHLIEDIMNTNAFEITVNEESHSALYPEIGVSPQPC